jgi:lipoate-protein ligase A
MPDPLRWTDAAFPGRAAFDVAVSRALLRDVARGRAPETLRLYRPDAVMAFSTTDLRRPGFGEALAAARGVGFDAALRLAGGSAAVFHPQTLAFAWCTPEAEPRDGIRARFERIAGLVIRALQGLGVDARVGAVPGEYCPGAYSVNAGGGRKLMGVGQRIVRGAAHVGGVIVVRDRALASRGLAPVYRALGLDYDPRATGCVEDEAPGATLEIVRDALLAEVARQREVLRVPLAPETLAGASDFEASHRLEAPHQRAC